MENTAKQKIITALKIAGNVLLYVFFAVCLFVLLLSIFSKRDVDGAVDIFGYEMRLVLTGSMEKDKDTDVSAFKIKDLPKNSAVFIERVPEDDAKANAWYAALKEGDVLTFRYKFASQQLTVTHRIIAIEETGSGGYLITLQGDNKADTSIPGTSSGPGKQYIYTTPEDSDNEDSVYNFVLGKVVGKSTTLGWLVNTLKQPVGISLIVIVPCAVIIVFEIIRIVNVLNGEKRRKVEEAAAEQQTKMEEQQSQMEALLRRIAELEKGVSQDAAPAAEPTGPPAQEEAVEATPVQAETVESAPMQEEAVEATPVQAEAVESAPMQEEAVEATPVQAETAEPEQTESAEVSEEEEGAANKSEQEERECAKSLDSF